MALLGSIQGALGGKEVARGVVGLVVCATNLQRKRKTSYERSSNDFMTKETSLANVVAEVEEI